MTRFALPALSVLAWITVSACEEETPMGLGGALIPVTPTTVEVIFSWDEFTSGFEVFGGFGAVSSLDDAVLANGVDGALDSRVLFKPSFFPSFFFVEDSLGVLVVDTALTYVGGTVVAELRRPSGDDGPPVELLVHALQQRWDVESASWEMAVDTIGDAEPWEEPGAGPGVLLAEGEWDSELGDTVFIPLDSADVALMAALDVDMRAIRMDIVEEGVRLDASAVQLRLNARPSVNRDTIVEVPIVTVGSTFVFDPPPTQPDETLRVGGAPSWRSVIEMSVPEFVNGPPSLCERVECPLELLPDRVNSAALLIPVLPSEPGFEIGDSIFLDARPVVAPERLPKSPLGASVLGPFGFRVGSVDLIASEEPFIAVPITPFVRDLLRGETAVGGEVSTVLALLNLFEPQSFGYLNLAGSEGDTDGLRLRIILTTADPVRIR